MKKQNQILVTLSIVALLGGCSEEEVQRDVYHSLEDCLADWQKIELCEADKNGQNAPATQMNTDQQATQQTGNSLSGLGLRSADSDANAVPNAQSGSEGASLGSAIAGGVMGYMAARAISNFLGPSYHPSNRAVSTPSGQVIQPQTNRSVGKPMLVKGNAGSMNSKPVSRGGFTSPSNSNRQSSGG